VLPRNNAPYIVGMCVLSAVFLLVAAVTYKVVPALVLGVLLGVAAIFIWHGLFPSSPELDAFNMDVRRRVKKAHDTIKAIRSRAAKLRGDDLPSREQLEQACQTVLDLLLRVQEKSRDNVPKTAARMQNYMARILVILGEYQEVKANTAYYDDADKQLEQGRQSFKSFYDFALARMREVTAGDMVAYRTQIEALELPPLLK
jgi:hypothetical protein